jgi:hypothetical protein
MTIRINKLILLEHPKIVRNHGKNKDISSSNNNKYQRVAEKLTTVCQSKDSARRSSLLRV